MAKSTTKTTAEKATPKAAVKKATTKKEINPVELIEKAAEQSLLKLRELNLEYGLQGELEWCLGSFRTDGNPVGLYEKVESAVSLFKSEKERKTKGVTAKLINDLEAALKSR